MSKVETIVRKLVADGWRVDNDGQVVKPDGTIRNTSIRKGIPNKEHGGSRPDYRKFNVKHEGEAFPVPVHKLVGFQIHGDAAFTSLVRHLDNDSLNNRPTNIGIGNGTDNAMDRPEKERKAHADVARVNAVKVTRVLTDDEAFGLLEFDIPTKTLAREMGISPSTITRVRQRKSYKHITG